MPYVLSKWGNKLLTAIVAEFGGWGWESIKHWLFENEERKTHKEKMILSCTEDLHLIIRANVY